MTNIFSLLPFSPESSIFEANALRLEVSMCASNTYATESLLYMTVGLMDLYKNSNLDVETAILKVSDQDCLEKSVRSEITFIKFEIFFHVDIFTRCITFNGIESIKCH